MASYLQLDGDKEFQRQISGASTALPSSTPPMSRMVSSENEPDLYDFLEEFKGDCVVFASTKLPDEVSKAVLPTVESAQSQTFNAHSSIDAMIYSMVMLGFLVCALLDSASLRIFLGVVAALMLAVAILLPRLYVYVMDACPPEVCGKDDNESQLPGISLPILLVSFNFWFFMGHMPSSVSLSLDSIYGPSTSIIFITFTGLLTAMMTVVMFLPKIYVRVMESCGFEDAEEQGEYSFVLDDFTED